MTRRGHLEVIADLLRTLARGKMRITPLIYENNCCWTRMNIYLNDLRDKGIVKNIPPYWDLTADGWETLYHADELRRALL